MPHLLGLAPAVVVSRDQTQNLPRAVVDAALRASPDNLPAWVSADLGSQGTAVVKVLRIIPREGRMPSKLLSNVSSCSSGGAQPKGLHTTKCSRSVSRFKSNLPGPSLPIFDHLNFSLKLVREFGL